MLGLFKGCYGYGFDFWRCGFIHCSHILSKLPRLDGVRSKCRSDLPASQARMGRCGPPVNMLMQTFLGQQSASHSAAPLKLAMFAVPGPQGS
jgi:hypothetical protein